MSEKMLEGSKQWSTAVAELVVDALLVAKLIPASAVGKAIEISAEEILVRLCLGDYPIPEVLRNWALEVESIGADSHQIVGRHKTGLVVSKQGARPDLLVWAVIAEAIEIESKTST